MKRLQRLGCCFAFALPLVMGQPPKDVDGWGKVKWGMSVVQARTAYGNEIRYDVRLHDGLIGLRLNNVKVGTLEMGALLQVSGERINGAELSIIGISGSERDNAYNNLKAMLIDKYGAATIDDPKTRTIWVFPSTLITLDTQRTAVLEITYKPADAGVVVSSQHSFP